MKLLDENIGHMLHDTGFGTDFLDMASKTQATKEKVDKLDFMKICKFLLSKDNKNNQPNFKMGK